MKLLWAESLANPGGIVSDIRALADIAKEAGIPLIIDNTMATPYLCQPLQHGADIVVHSVSRPQASTHTLSPQPGVWRASGEGAYGTCGGAQTVAALPGGGCDQLEWSLFQLSALITMSASLPLLMT